MKKTKMPEAEVSLTIACRLLESDFCITNVRVAIDGAQIKTGKTIHFDIEKYLRENGFNKITTGKGWQGTYEKFGCKFKLIVHSNPGKGDVIASLRNGRTLRIESKKGPLMRSKSSEEYPLLREAIGHLMTVEEVGQNDILVVAVPDSKKFNELINRWKCAPLIKAMKIDFLTVRADGIVTDLERVAT
jgi:hypothetical protein